MTAKGYITGNEPALIVYAVNRLPDYLAAVEALERLMAALDGDGTDDMGAVFAADAALARLREPVA